MNKTTVIGVFLVLFGGLTFLGNFGFAGDSVVLSVISLGFLFLYFIFGAWKRRANVGFLIPGMIMGAIGFYVLLEDNNLIPPGADSIFLVILGAAFLLIMFIHTLRIKSLSWGERYWPVFPGGILVMVGAIDLTTSVSSTIYSLITPVVLVLIGGYLLFTQLNVQKEKNTKMHGNESVAQETKNGAENGVNLEKDCNRK